eukprot:CAMPEP_0114297754 /NCGR_PEP_ID=MMETSP0059-20121206/12030_1 /TAXON_ID=36894 /ORGANISM="Pyramimonas parkeae, Strain CCMP726" /LENGTH=279 /DNA_ID=CAMNT_0001420023 /DNA_START=206 /DNA_END=1045 /DNA_ORIENTATION=-
MPYVPQSLCSIQLISIQSAWTVAVRSFLGTRVTRLETSVTTAQSGRDRKQYTMFSFESLVVMVGSGVLLLGPKELPIIARNLGYISGRAVAFLLQARVEFNQVTDNSEMKQLHEEVAESMHKLSQVRDEIRTGFNPFRSTYQPGPIARSAMRMASETTKQGYQQSTHQAATSRHSNCAVMEASQYTEGMWEQGSSVRAQMFPSSTTHSSSPLTTNSHHTGLHAVQPLPISALSLGRVPNRLEHLPSGADLISDSILEREVGMEGQKMMESLQSSQPTSK